tara:strand:- start:77 stop:325 length:249 start_codon:yes stop_codon:yes gene_type:complete
MPDEKTTWKDINDMYKNSSSPGSERRRLKMEKFRQEHPGTKASDVYQKVIVTTKPKPTIRRPEGQKRYFGGRRGPTASRAKK